MPSLNHTHQYRRHPKNRRVYMCVDSHCTHYTYVDFLEGKASICNKCGIEFILNKQQLKNANPVCILCSKSKKKETLAFAKKLLEGLEGLK